MLSLCFNYVNVYVSVSLPPPCAISFIEIELLQVHSIWLPVHSLQSHWLEWGCSSCNFICMVSFPSSQAPRGSSCSSVWTGHSYSRVRDAGSCATWPCTLCRWMCGTVNPSCLSAPQPWGSRYSKTGLLASPHMVRRHTLTGSCPCFFLPHDTLCFTISSLGASRFLLSCQLLVELSCLAWQLVVMWTWQDSTNRSETRLTFCCTTEKRSSEMVCCNLT